MRGPASAAPQKAGSSQRNGAQPRDAARGVSSAAIDPVLSLQASAGNVATSNLLRSVVGASAQPLAPALRSDMESRFGEDFRDVRVHLGERADQSASDLDAKAYTLGSHLVFAAGQFAPQTGEGRRLLAHELAHVVQQRRGGAPPALDAGAAHEVAADRAAGQVANGAGPATVAGATGVGVARLEKPDPEPAARTRERIEKAQNELDTLQAARDKAGGKLTQAQTIAAADALESAMWRARVSKNSKLRKAAEDLRARYDAIVKGTPAQREAADPFDQGLARGRLSPREGINANLMQRGANVSPPAHRFEAELAELEKKRAATKDEKQREDLAAKIEATNERLSRARRASNPDKSEGEEFGHSARTFATVQVIDRQGKVITLQAENKGHDDKHAEDVIIEKLNALPDKKRLAGARMTIFGDQEVCDRCAKRLPEFARANGLKKIVGVTEHAPQLDKEGQLTGRNEPAKKSTQMISHPQEARARSAAQGRTEEEGVQTRFETVKIWPPQGEAGHGHDHPHDDPDTPAPDTPAPAAGEKKPAKAKKSVKKDEDMAGAKPAKDAAKADKNDMATPGAGTSPGKKSAAKTKQSAAAKALPESQPSAGPASPAPAPAAKPQSPVKRQRKAEKAPPTPPAPSAEGLKGAGTAADGPPAAAHKAAKGKVAAPAPAGAQHPPAAAPAPTAASKPSPVGPAPVAKAPTAVPPHAQPPKTTAPPAAKPQANAPRPSPLSDKPKTPAPKAGAAPAGPGAGPAPQGSKVSLKGQIKPVVGSSGGGKGAGPGPGPAAAGGPKVQVAPGGKLSGGEGHVGAQGMLSAGAEQSRGGGVKTHQSAFAGAKVLVSGEDVPDAHPAQMRVRLTISLGAGAGVGASREGAVGGSLTAGASGSLTIGIAHVLPAEDAQRYLTAAQTGAGGAQRELQAIQLLAAGSTHDARQILNEMKAAGGSAEAAKKAKAGDEFSVAAEGQVEGGLGVDAKGGSVGVGANVGISRAGGVQRSQSFDEKGRLIITVSIHDDTTVKGGLSGSFEAVSMGVDASRLRGKSTSVTFVLDPSDPNKNARIDEIYATTTLQGLQALAQRRPELSGSVTTGHSQGKSKTVSAGALGGGIGITDTSSYGESVTHDASGVTRTFEGSGGGGAEATIGGRTVAKFSQTDRFVGSAGPGNKGSGESSSAKSETDYGRSLVSAAEHPLGTAAGLLSGDAKVLKESTDVQGVKMNDDSYATLSSLAENPAAWQKAWNRSGTNVDTYTAWVSAGEKVRQAKGDRALIAKAMAQFESKGSGRSKVLENAVGDSGVGFEFPEGLGEQKAVYDSLVAGDPIGEARALADQGKANEAIAALNADNDKLSKLARTLGMHGDDFKNEARLNEMMLRINDRATAIRAEVRRLSPAPGPAPKPAPSKPGVGPPTADQASQQAEAERAAREEADAKRKERNARIDILVPACLLAADKERNLFNQIDDENNSFFGPNIYHVINLLNRDKDSWGNWDRMVQELKQIFQERGESPDRANQYAPKRGEWQTRYTKWKGPW